MTFILDDSSLLEIIKYVRLAGTWSNPPLMGRVLPDPWSKWVGLSFNKNNKKNRNGFGLGSGIMQTQPEPDPYTYIILKKIKKPLAIDINIF